MAHESESAPTAPQFSVMLLDENDQPFDAEAFSTYEEAVDTAREGAAFMLEHVSHGHFIPSVTVYSIPTDKRVWYWCPPIFSAEGVDTGAHD